MVIHRRLRLASYRRTDTGETRRMGSRKHVLRTTGPCVRRLVLLLHLLHLLFPLAASFPLSFSSGRDVASVWQDWQVARSFRSARFRGLNRSSRTRQAEQKRNRERARSVAAGPLGRLQTSRIHQIQLTQTELESKESVRWCSPLPSYLLAFRSC